MQISIKTIKSQYNIPQGELISILINLEGVHHNSNFKRIRFELYGPTKKKLMFSVENNKKSNFTVKNNNLVLGNYIIGYVKEICEDSCEVFYTRNNGKVLCFNPNSRSSCSGCKFCYNPSSSDDKRIISENDIYFELLNWCKRNNYTNLSHIEQIAVVTGCFRNENIVFDYLFKLRCVSSNLSFNGEILFFGMPLEEQTIINLNSIKPFNLCFTIECFENRKNLIRKDKLSDLKQIKDLMSLSKQLGIKTNFSYILGLDSLDIINTQFPTFLNIINWFPIISIYQTDNRRKTLRNNAAFNIDYYLKAREIIEKVFFNSEMRPTTWSNHRSLWREYFGNEYL
jgi:hypothetical protein